MLPKPAAVQECALGLMQCPLRSTGQVSLILVEAEERTRAASVSQEANAAKDRECAIPSPLLCGCEDGSGMGEGHRVGRDFKASC